MRQAMAFTPKRMRPRTALALVTALAVLTTGVLWWTLTTESGTRVTAYFTRTVGLYEGSAVKVLGVTVGEVRSITPQPKRVKVVVTVEEDVPIAADTGAVIVAPSVVADRYLQFTKLTESGAQLSDGDVIPTERTETPVEIDQLYRTLNNLAKALGPKGANKNGALSELIETTAKNLRGNGEAFNRAIRKFADLARTLSGSRHDLFATIKELQTFTTMLANNDAKVESLNTKLATVSQALAEDRQELSGALRMLAGALGEIKTFIAENRDRIEANVEKLADITQLIVENRASIAEALDILPLAATNVYKAFDPESGKLQARALLLEYFLRPSKTGGGGAGDKALPMPLPGTASVTTQGGGN